MGKPISKKPNIFNDDGNCDKKLCITSMYHISYIQFQEEMERTLRSLHHPKLVFRPWPVPSHRVIPPFIIRSCWLNGRGEKRWNTENPDGSDLPIQVAQWHGPGNWRDSFGKVAPGCVTTHEGKKEYLY